MIVETETAVYLLDLVLGKLRRYPRDAVVEVENSPHEAPAEVAHLRQDGESIPFEFLAPVEVGKPAQFVLLLDGGVTTIRTTTDVINISTEDSVRFTLEDNKVKKERTDE